MSLGSECYFDEMLREVSNYIPFLLIPLIGWGVARHLRRKNDLTVFKQITLSIGLTAFFITEMTRSFWRPYVYSNSIFDYYFSDTIGNTFGTVTAIFIVLTLAGKGTRQDWKLICIIIAGLAAFEFFDYPSRFDPNDLIATFVFGIPSMALYFVLLRKFGPEDET